MLDLWKHSVPKADDTTTEDTVVEPVKDESPQESAAALCGEEGVISGCDQTKALISVKLEPCENGVQEARPSSDTSAAITASVSSSANISNGQQHATELNVLDENPAQLEKPLEDSDNVPPPPGLTGNLGVVKKEGPPLSPLPALVPASREVYGEEHKEQNTKGQLDLLEDKPGSVQLTSEAETRKSSAVDSKSSSLSQPCEQSIDGITDTGVSARNLSESPILSTDKPVKQENTQGSLENKSDKEPLSAVENLLDDITLLQDNLDCRMNHLDKQLSSKAHICILTFPLPVQLN